MQELGLGGHGDPHHVVGGRAHSRAYTRRHFPRARRDQTVELRLETRDEGEWTVLDVGGEIDLSTAPTLRTRIDALIHDGARRLVVNLERVAFLDSSGLSVLIAAMKGMQAAGGRLAIAGARESVLKVFAVTGTDRVFTIHGSVAEATAA